MSNEELTQALTDLKTEVDGVNANVVKLEAAITAGGDTVPQTVVDAFTALKGSVDTLNTTAVVPGT